MPSLPPVISPDLITLFQMFQLSLTQFQCNTSLKPFLSCVCPPAILMFYLLLICSQQVSTYRSLLAVSLANLGQHLFSNLKKKKYLKYWKKLLPSSSFKLLREKKCYLWKGVTTQTMTKECDNSRWIFEWNAFSGPDPYMFYFRQESLVREKQRCIQLNSQYIS